MQKKFTKYLSLYMLIAFIVIMSIIFALQTILAQSNQKKIALDKINNILLDFNLKLKINTYESTLR